MKVIKSTKSGFDFQTNVENILLSSGLFGNDIGCLSNVYSYTDLINSGVANMGKFLSTAEENIFLFKNYPLFNYLNEAIEFCIVNANNNKILGECYVECKFYDVNGTAYQKLYHYLVEHANAHRYDNSYMILVYDGQDFYGDTKTNLQVQNIKENYIKYNFKQLVLEVNDFQNVFLKKLRAYNGDFSKIFVEMKKEGY